ncbi:MAG: asparagine synthetase B, partial [Burkholderiales bacterium]|nr:asparagine synthetase B [Burkholderiales bacterium]
EDGVPVLLEGQGADEALAGYPHYFAVAIWQQFVNASLRPNRANLCELRALLKGASRTFSPRWTLMWLARELLPSLTGPYRRRVGAGETLRSEYRLPLHEASAQRRSGRYADKVNNRLWADHSSAILPGLLQYGDAVSMAHSVESRLPFMDYRLVEWLFSRGSDIKLGHGQSKRILRSYLHRIGQQSIAERADKRGFPTPAERWLSEDNGAILREALLQTDSRLAEFCEPARMRRLVDAHCAGRGGTGNHLYRLLSSELWMRESLR